MYTITKQFTFEAAHQLYLPYVSKCNKLHGHSYIVELVLQAEILNPYGVVVDFNDLTVFGAYIDGSLDHSNLNEQFSGPTTAENIAYWLYLWAKKEWAEVVAVRVSETRKTWAEYHE